MTSVLRYHFPTVNDIRERFKLALQSDSPILRNEAIKHIDIIGVDRAFVKICLSSKYSDVRIFMAQRHDAPFDRVDYDAGLQDSDVNVVYHLLQYSKFLATDGQLEAGLTHELRYIRVAFAKYADYREQGLTEGQIERGVGDESVEVRNAFIYNDKIQLTKEQINTCLMDSNKEVVSAILYRDDYVLSDDQINYLIDKFIDEARVNKLSTPLENLIYRKDFCPTVEIELLLKSSKNPKIYRAWDFCESELIQKRERLQLIQNFDAINNKNAKARNAL